MKIEEVRIRDRGGEGEGLWSVSLLFPRFTEEAEGHERLNDFYRKLAEAVCGAAQGLSCTALSEMRVVCDEDTFYSLVLDVLFYRNRNLIACKRIADTRLWKGIALPPPKEVGRCVPKNGGWYYNGEQYVLFQNTFTPEQGSGVRRSEYRKFLTEEIFR
ncbi:MAG: hypothetical protein IJD10_01835 [Clostridia bacterium]|nr:hypothetical protein [Clostridia bacterium]